MMSNEIISYYCRIKTARDGSISIAGYRILGKFILGDNNVY